MLARMAVTSDGSAARVIRSLGGVHVRAEAVIGGLRDRQRRNKERKQAEERAAWGREHTKAARIIKPGYP